MKKIMLYSLFSVLAAASWLGSHYIDSLNKPAQVKSVTVNQVKKSECIDRLFNNVKPLLYKADCDSHTFYFPTHWWLQYRNACNGQVHPLMVFDGLQNYEFRKNLWKNHILLLTSTFLGLESSTFGGAADSWIQIGKSALIGLDIANVGIDAISENNIRIKVLREPIGRIIRPLIFNNKYATFKNSFERLSNVINKISTLADGVELFQKNGIRILNDESIIEIPIDIANKLYLFSCFSEFELQTSDFLSSQLNIDNALVDAANEIKVQSDEELLKNFIELLSKDEITKFISNTIDNAKFLGGILNIFSHSPFLGGTLVFLQSACWGWDMWTNIAQKGYAFQLYQACTGYTMAGEVVDNDIFSSLIRALSLIIADKSIYSHFEGNFVNLFVNLKLPDPISTGWHDVLFNDSRNQELNYLINGYKLGVDYCIGNINGRVINIDKNPIPDAQVSLIRVDKITKVTYNNSGMYQLDPNNILYASTDLQGNFIYKIMEDGDYTIRVSKQGYCTENMKITINQGKPLINNEEHDIIITLRTPNIIPSGTLNTKYFAQGLTVIADLTNDGCKDNIDSLGDGTTFRPKNPYQQNIVLSKGYKLYAFANSTTRYSLPGYCISRYKSGPSSELALDKSLNKKEYETVLKTAEQNNWNNTKHGDVQSALWYFSDGIGISKGTIADSLVKIASEASGKKQVYGYKIDTPPSLGSLLCTLLTTFPLYLISRKFIKV
ncbi:MAG: carboxypeptidase-like regulatory domain-containing protein [Ignavibacteriaceae bacterium]|jgi:hypothetical protein